MLLPLLHTIGLPGQSFSPDGVSQHLLSWFTFFHISLTLKGLLSCFFILSTLIALGHFCDEWMRTVWQERYLSMLQCTMYRALLDTRWDFFIQNKHGEMVHGLTAQLQAIWMCHFQILQLFNQSMLASVYMVLCCFVSWKMTLFATLFAGVLLSLLKPFHRLMYQRGVTYLRHNQTLFQLFYEQLNVFKIAKSSACEQVLLRKVTEETQAVHQQSQYFTLIRAGSKLLYQVSAAFAFMTLLYMAWAVYKLPVAQLIILIVFFSRLFPMVSSLQQSYQQLLGQLPKYAHLKQFLAQLNEQQEQRSVQKSIDFQHTIAFENVSFRYAADQAWIVQSLSLCIKKNTTTVIMGASGSGKTTLIDLLIGLLQPTQGHIALDSTPLDACYRTAWRRKIAYVAQDTFLFNTTVRENLVVFCAEKPSEESIWRTLRMMAIDEVVRHLPDGLDTIVGERGVRLSGGERQRLALARALLMQPELLILDESTNALDHTTITLIQNALNRLHGQVTLIIISHQTQLQALADVVIHLNAPNDCVIHQTVHQGALCQPILAS